MSDDSNFSKKWQQVQLYDIIDTIESGKRPRGGSGNIKSGVPSIGGEHLNQNGGFNLQNCKFVPENFFEQQNKGMMRKNDILIVKDGATTGKVSIVDENFPFEKAMVNEHIFILRPKSNSLPRWLFYYIFSSPGQSQIKQNMHGMIGGINTNFLKNFKINLPPLQVQEKIISILDKSVELKNNSKKAQQLVDDLLLSTFLEMFGNPQTNPKKWPVKQIQEFAVVGTGGTPKRNMSEYYGDSIPWVKTTEAKNNVIYETEEGITQEGLENSNATIFPVGTVLVAMYGQGKTRGKTAKLGIQAATNQAFAAILPSKYHDSDYVWYLLRHSYETLRQMARGGNQPNLNVGMIKSFQIPLPPLKLQKEFSDIVEKHEKTKNRLLKAGNNFENLFSTLSKKAFYGELMK